MIRFGVAGNSHSFYDEGHQRTFEAAEWLRARGLDAFEYSFGKGVRISRPSADRIYSAFASRGLELSVHAPYYINFANPDPIRIEASVGYVVDSLKAFPEVKRVVVHPATQGESSRADALDRAERNLALLAETMVGLGMSDRIVCLETMGKTRQIGSTEEIIRLTHLAPFFYPCIDFGHINARTHGGLKTEDDFARILDALFDRLPREKAVRMHAHFSKIKYGDAGELRHLTFADAEYGPDFEPLLNVLARYGAEPILICESDGTQAEDARTMKDYYLKLVENR